MNGKITLTATKPPHMRGIKQAIEEIKQADPYTALTEPALRRKRGTLCKSRYKIFNKYGYT